VVTRRYELAAAKLQRLAADNAPLGSRISAEIEFAQSYDEMVRAGTMPKLRAKYRLG
jgi:hypothetical protein